MSNNSEDPAIAWGRLAPKPLRNMKYWLSFECLINSGLNPDGIKLMNDRGQVTCR